MCTCGLRNPCYVGILIDLNWSYHNFPVINLFCSSGVCETPFLPFSGLRDLCSYLGLFYPLFFNKFTITPSLHLLGTYSFFHAQLSTSAVISAIPSPPNFINSFTIPSAPAPLWLWSFGTHFSISWAVKSLWSSLVPLLFGASSSLLTQSTTRFLSPLSNVVFSEGISSLLLFLVVFLAWFFRCWTIFRLTVEALPPLFLIPVLLFFRRYA